MCAFNIIIVQFFQKDYNNENALTRIKLTKPFNKKDKLKAIITDKKFFL
jgi:hypothetical protein